MDEITEEVTVECASCATDVPQDEVREVNDESYCDSCADEFGMCENCETSVLQEDLVLVYDMDTYRWRPMEKHVCDSCADEKYHECDSCSERHSSLEEVLDGSSVCEGCRENMNYCDHCDGYYSDYSDEDHTHSGCDCEVPSGLEFRVKNGDEWLKNDTRVSVDLPGGVISEVGMSLIANAVQKVARDLSQVDQALVPYTEEWRTARKERGRVLDQWYEFSYTIEWTVGTDWQTNRGNFTKRLSRAAHKAGLKMPTDLLTKIGNIAREQSTGSSVNLEISRDLNMSATEWGHEDSCWFTAGSYGDSRCALKSNGGFGLRTFATDSSYNVTGRVWALPLRKVEDLVPPSKASVYHAPGTGMGGLYGNYTLETTEGPAQLINTLEPTFDTETPDAWMIFNGYGDLSGYAGARIMAGMSGMTYRKCNFEADPMYVNAGGYIVADEETATRIAQTGLGLRLMTHSSLYDRERQMAAQAA